MNKTICLLLSVLCIFLVHLPTILTAAECAQVVPSFNAVQIPDHFITYQDESAPEWKNIWDQARSLYSLKKFGQAQVQYELLLAGKDNIDQARWEYVITLMCRRQWQKADTELALLISHDPDRPEYLLAKAEIALSCGDFNRAVGLFAPLYAQQCAVTATTEDKVRILTGYIAALEGLGRTTTLIPLMEQLIRLLPEDYALQQRTADIAMEIGQPGRAFVLLRSLEERNPEDIEVLIGLAKVQTALENRTEAAVYWQRIVGLYGGNREAHEQLIQYYRDAGNQAMELKHVEALLSIESGDSNLLVQAGRLNLVLGRPDRALEYYNWLLNVDPGNKAIIEQKDRALHEIAGKLLALIENTGSELLWQDLVQVTGDRVGVYRTLADMLREQGKRDKLIQVLLVIHKESPGDVVAGNELTALLNEQGRLDILASSRDGDTESPDIISQ